MKKHLNQPSFGVGRAIRFVRNYFPQIVEWDKAHYKCSVGVGVDQSILAIPLKTEK